jgi:hypothetical protein
MEIWPAQRRFVCCYPERHGKWFIIFISSLGSVNIRRVFPPFIHGNSGRVRSLLIPKLKYYDAPLLSFGTYQFLRQPSCDMLLSNWHPRSVTCHGRHTITIVCANRIYLSVCLSVCLSACLSVRPSIHPSINLFFHRSIDPSIHPSIEPCIDPSIHPSIRPSINLFFHRSIDPSIHRTVHRSVHSSIDPSIHPSIHVVPTWSIGCPWKLRLTSVS